MLPYLYASYMVTVVAYKSWYTTDLRQSGVEWSSYLFFSYE